MESVCGPMEPDEDTLGRNAEETSWNKEDTSPDQMETLCNLDVHLEKGNKVETPEPDEEIAMGSGDAELDSGRESAVNMASTINLQKGSEVETLQPAEGMAMGSGDAALDRGRESEVNMASTSLDKADVLSSLSHKVQDKGMEAITSESEEQECVVDTALDFVIPVEQENGPTPSGVNPEIKAEIRLDDSVKSEPVNESITCEDNMASEESFTRSDSVTCEDARHVSKLEVSSEDEEVHLYTNSRKSGAESSSSKDESPSGPSCSGTSRAGVNSLSSDSEDDLPSLNFTLPIKKRKRETPVSSDDECKSEIDYANLTPEEIKALIEEAKRYGTIKRCKCPKKKWEELPIKGPIETSKKCNIGKGDWSEKTPCEACSSGVCLEVNHKYGRRTRRRAPHILLNPRINNLSKTRARGTIGQDVPVIDLSDSEEASSLPANVASEVTITAVSAIPRAPEECIVLSSSEDDDDIVCEGVVWSDNKKQATGAETSSAAIVPKEVSPDVVELQQPPQALPPPIGFGIPPIQLPTPSPQDSESWPDLSIDIENWNDTFNLLANIVGPPNADIAARMPSDRPPDRPPTPEGWSCPICLESKTAVIEIMSTTCGHVFCGNCIRSAVKIHKKCPTCRKKLTLKQFHRIFL